MLKNKQRTWFDIIKREVSNLSVKCLRTTTQLSRRRPADLRLNTYSMANKKKLLIAAIQTTRSQSQLHYHSDSNLNTIISSQPSSSSRCERLLAAECLKPSQSSTFKVPKQGSLSTRVPVQLTRSLCLNWQMWIQSMMSHKLQTPGMINNIHKDSSRLKRWCRRYSLRITILRVESKNISRTGDSSKYVNQKRARRRTAFSIRLNSPVRRMLETNSSSTWPSRIIEKLMIRITATRRSRLKWKVIMTTLAKVVAISWPLALKLTREYNSLAQPLSSSRTS